MFKPIIKYNKNTVMAFIIQEPSKNQDKTKIFFFVFIFDLFDIPFIVPFFKKKILQPWWNASFIGLFFTDWVKVLFSIHSKWK